MAGSSTSGSVPSIELRFAAFAVLLLAGCVHSVRLGEPPTPERAPEEAVERLRRLESFRFRLDYRTDTPTELSARFSGIWQAPDREAWQGVWLSDGRREPVRLVAAGDVQYRAAGRLWEREPRGFEARLLEQLRQALDRRRFTRDEESARRWVYDFEPWLPLLDPGRQRHFDASLVIDPDNGLPLSVSAQDSAGRAFWKLRLDRFNRAGRVELPFRPEVEVRLEPERRVGRLELDLMVRSVRERLAGLGWEWRLFRRCGRLVLQVGQAVPPSRVELLVVAGAVELWEVEPLPVGDRSESSWLVGDDASFRVRPIRVLARNGDFRASAEGLLLPEPRIEVVAARDSLPATAVGNLVALVLDGDVLAATTATGTGAIGFQLPLDRLGSELVAVLANHRAAPAGFRAVPVP
jgi:hypothetical protein